MNDDHWDPEHFCGITRLFPLPNVVLFPHVLQPLHIFEPRYRQMTADALDDDRLIALAQLRPGWEANYACSPAIYPVACLGKIVAHQKLEDGRYNILLQGLSRIRIVREVPHEKQYRLAKVELLTEVPLPSPDLERKLRRQMIKLVPTWFPAADAVLKQFRKLLRSELPLGSLCDIIAFALPFEVEVSQALLAELDVGQRVRRLLHHLANHEPPKGAAADQRQFPPEFSRN